MLRVHPAGVTLSVRIQPGARRTAIIGIYGEGESGQLKVTVHAPPLEGRANLALIDLVAEKFAIAKSAVELKSGESSRSKILLLRGVTIAQARQVLDLHNPST